MAINSGLTRGISIVALAAAIAVGAPSVVAADEHVAGVITVRTGDGFAISTPDGTAMLIDLSEATQIKSEGRKAAASDLIPGLRVKVDGEYGDRGRLVADKVKFSKSDLRTAQAIRAGMVPLEHRVDASAMDIQKHGVTLGEHAGTLQQHATDIVANDQKMVATTGAITTRINDLDAYNAIDSINVHFGNAKATISEDNAAQLKAFAEKAKGIEGYKIQIQGYASAVGSAPFNEMLSAMRAEAVTSMLVQGGIPPSNIFVPAAMGTSEQVAENTTKDGQAQNRRVVVTILQSKGLVDR